MVGQKRSTYTQDHAGWEDDAKGQELQGDVQPEDGVLGMSAGSEKQEQCKAHERLCRHNFSLGNVLIVVFVSLGDGGSIEASQADEARESGHDRDQVRTRNGDRWRAKLSRSSSQD